MKGDFKNFLIAYFYLNNRNHTHKKKTHTHTHTNKCEQPIVVELVPSYMKTTALSIYFFVIGLGGFFTYLVPSFESLFG